jgi:signal transduction histidine kinase
VRFHEPAWGVLPLAAGALNFVTAAWVAVVFTQMLIIQPMLEDVVAHLPAGFEPEVRGVSFRRRAVAPLMVVFCFGMGLTAAFANLVGDGIWRFTLVACVSLPVVAIAYLMFLMISRSVLDPVSAVIDAADRVRRGDLATPVPVLSADELGTLAHRFNEMLNGLRERERLREDLLGRTEELRASRQRIVNAADAERRRMERDLHDGAQQRLVLLRLKLSMLERFMDTDADKAKAMRRELTEEIDCALVELRDLAHGIYPTALETEGLPAALRDALPRSALPVDLDAGEIGRYPAEIEAAVYFCCLEALQNAAKHAGQHARAAIHLEQQNGVLRFEVTDDGAGFDPGRASASAGIQNMADRIGALGGELHVDSTPGHGTKIAGTIPLET